MAESYIVPYQEATYEFTEKHSRFIGHIFKIETAEQASEILSRLRKKYWDATHNVYAYVLSSGTERFSDDGEPSGTSGMPTLTVLRGAKVQNVLCVTTRYFGGTLLGAGGLVRAYSQAAKGALDAAGLAVMTPFKLLRVSCDYSFLQPLRYALPNLSVTETGCEYGAEVVLELMVEPQFCDKAVQHITDISAGKVVPEIVGEKLLEKKL
ncbi:MAG: YigZ family protein [Clostridia bacterium]|nr:YigZ family protein [Clostridia bacterium]MBR5903041.1 YigZ family protein [Clostridia bacterium]